MRKTIPSICRLVVLGAGLVLNAAAAPSTAPGGLRSTRRRARTPRRLLMWQYDVVAKKKEVWFDTTVAELAERRSARSRSAT